MLFFPEPKTVSLAPNISSLLFSLDGVLPTQILLSQLAPGSRLAAHQHVEAQMGLAIGGKFSMQVGETEATLSALQTAYVANPFVSHAAENKFDAPATAVDIKRAMPVSASNASPFLALQNEICLKTGIILRFFACDWCEIMVSEIPPGAHMPLHRHAHEQYGVAVLGKYIMQVEHKSIEFSYGQVYQAPPQVLHGAHNPFDTVAVSLNIFFPPRYQKALKKGKK